MTDRQLRDWMAKVSAWRRAKDVSIDDIWAALEPHLDKVSDMDGRLAALEAAEAARKARKKPDGNVTADELAAAERVLGRLNEHTGKRLRVQGPAGVTEHARTIAARLRKGYSETDLRMVVWHRCLEWCGDEQMEKWLRPATIFAVTKLDGYLDEARAAYEQQTGDDPDQLTEETAPAAVIQLAAAMKERA
jgi:uncharacterized phage protein (TIGR02220 family)